MTMMAIDTANLAAMMVAILADTDTQDVSVLRAARDLGMPIVEVLRERLLGLIDADMHRRVEEVLVLNYEEFLRAKGEGLERGALKALSQRNASLIASVKESSDTERANVRGLSGEMVIMTYLQKTRAALTAALAAR